MSIDEIMHLDVAERIVIVEEIWDSLAREEADIPLSEYEKKTYSTPVWHHSKPIRTISSHGKRSKKRFGIVSRHLKTTNASPPPHNPSFCTLASAC